MSERLGKNIEQGVPLAHYTTLGVGGPAKYFIRIRMEDEIPEIIRWAQFKSLPILVLGGGSNMVVSDNGFPGLVIKMEIFGIKCIKETYADAEIFVGAGESWDFFVEYAVNNGLWGIENMSFIPGTVGAVAVQNVSAYGQESRTVINKVRAYDMLQAKFVELSNDQCEFGFRKSIFNTTEAGRYLIVAISFILRKNGKPNISRREIAHVIKKQRNSKGIKFSGAINFIRRLLIRKAIAYDYKLSEIRQAVIRLRTLGKLLPLPNTIGNCGTFFQASVVPKNQFYLIMRKAYNNIGLSLVLKIIACKWKYSSNRSFKLPARLFIESCSLEKICYGAISFYQNNTAVLVNSGNGANATDILKVIKIVRSIVHDKTGIVVPVEPSLVGFTDQELIQALSLTGDGTNMIDPRFYGKDKNE